MAPLRPRQATYRTIGRMVTVFTLNAVLITTAVALGTWGVSPGRTLSTHPPGDSSADPVPAAARPKMTSTYGQLPLSFEVNRGQSDGRVDFLARGQGYSLFLTPTEAVLSLHPTARQGAQADAVVRMRLADANPRPQVAGLELLPGTSNYFIGSDPRQWRRDVPSYARVKYSGVYPGIDLIYYGNQRQLEYDIVVAPHADPRRIALGFDGVETLSLDRDGNLVLHTSRGDIAQHKPVIYQDTNGRRQKVDGRYVLRANHGVGFDVADYDTSQALVIDPLLSYSTYLGGNGNDIGNAIAVDGAGNAYVTGVTTSTNFPGAGASPIQSTWRGSNDVFVTKLNAAGSALVYSTYLGGSGGDIGYAIAVDSAGNAYVTGETDSGTQSQSSIPFPTVGAFDSSYNGGGDAFVTKINASGNALVYSTFLGGGGNERGYGIAVDSTGNAYITGHTSSDNTSSGPTGGFPTLAPLQPDNNSPGSSDAFVTKLTAAGNALVYSTYLGGNASEFSIDGGAIAVDGDGNAYVGGTTRSTNFPGAGSSTIQPTLGGTTGRSDGFVVKLNAAGSALLYSTYLGGSTDDSVNGIAIDGTRNAYVVGSTDSPNNFPITAGSLQTSKGGVGFDAFVSKINAAGSALVYSTYLGGSDGETAYGVAVDHSGKAFVAGWTTSSNFPTVAPLQAAAAGSGDAFISELNAAGSALVFSTYLGGQSGAEHAYGIGLDGAGTAYVTGDTNSTNFPTAAPIQATRGAGTDAFVAKIVGTTNRFSYFADFAGTGCSGGQFLYRPSSGTSVTLLTNGDGTYNYVANSLTAGFDTLRTGDFTGDGKADLIVYNSSTALAYFGTGNGDGTFSFQSLFWSPGYDVVETGDLDGDGKTDVILLNSSTGTMYTGISNGTGGFTYKYTLVSTGYTYARLADFTGDGKGDVFLYKSGNGSSSLGVGDGIGGFAFSNVTVSPGYNLVDVGDLNGDGKADVILYNAANGNAVSGISNGAGGFAFTPMIFNAGFTSVRLANYTSDNFADVTVYNKNTASGFFGTGTGTGTFSFQSLFWNPGNDYVIPEHVNCDGKADVVLYNSTTGAFNTGISNGDGTFVYTSLLFDPGWVLVDQNHSSGPNYTAPTITESPFSHTVNPGSSVTFNAAADGNPTPQIQWQVSTNGGTTWSDVPGATANPYTFVAQTTDNGKKFRAVFTNAAGAATTTAATLGVHPTVQRAARADIDGDGASDLMLWRPSNGTWYSETSGNGFTTALNKQWGNAGLGDKPLQGDIDGDGIADLVVWRANDGTWYWLTSGTGYSYAGQGQKQWGNNSLGDIPILGDVDGDGRADLIIWRANDSTWYWLTSGTGYSYAGQGQKQWGSNGLGDKPMVADFDGDGEADLAVWRPSNSTWYWLTSSTAYSYASARSVQWGSNALGDKPLTGDIDGDGKADLIVWRPTDGTWYWLVSSHNYAYANQAGKQWGNNGLGDVPMIGDFDGDGKADLAVWRASSGWWYWLTSSSGYDYAQQRGVQWGTSGDVPMVK